MQPPPSASASLLDFGAPSVPKHTRTADKPLSFGEAAHHLQSHAAGKPESSAPPLEAVLRQLGDNTLSHMSIRALLGIRRSLRAMPEHSLEAEKAK